MGQSVVGWVPAGAPPSRRNDAPLLDPILGHPSGFYWVRWPQSPPGLQEPEEGLASSVAAPPRRGPTFDGMFFAFAPPFLFCKLSVSRPMLVA